MPRAWHCPASMKGNLVRVWIGILPKACPLMLRWLAASLCWARFSFLNAAVVDVRFRMLVSAELTPMSACLCWRRPSKCNLKKPWAAC